MGQSKIGLSRWRESAPLYLNDKATNLPLSHGIFVLRQDRETSQYRLCWDGKERALDTTDGFAAYHALIDAYRDWFVALPVPRVYFIGTKLRAGHDVKIGHSHAPEARLRQLQTAHPEKLMIFATVEGSQALEEKYHRRWHLRRRQGEWFMLGDCIINEINRLNAVAAG